MNNLSIYKHLAANAVLWHDIMRWIIEQVEAIDFDKPFGGEIKDTTVRNDSLTNDEIYKLWQRSFVEYGGEA